MNDEKLQKWSKEQYEKVIGGQPQLSGEYQNEVVRDHLTTHPSEAEYFDRLLCASCPKAMWFGNISAITGQCMVLNAVIYTREAKSYIYKCSEKDKQ